MASFLFILISLLTVFSLGCGWYLSSPVYPENTMKKPENFKNGRFMNAEPTTVMKPGSNWDSIYQFLFKGHRERTPSNPLLVAAMDGFAQQPASDGLRFVWLGHSSVLVELNGKRILVDPVLSERASFFTWAGPKRFQPAPIAAKDLPAVDAVLITHDHYDHLDRPTITAIASKTSFMPLGRGAAERLGRSNTKIHERLVG
jgi:hypothetical protein